ncbi:MAG: glycosyltransferase family 2 protein [Methanoregula sp.]|nr:glycosyltransferase family 2 protein [Methanoregula sp.]
MYDLTVIIPTFKEEANIRKIITEVDTVFQKNTLNGEILVVDDNSPDNTIAIVNDLKKTMANVNLLVRTTDHGLSQSVADGFLHASSDVFVVIDADLSHPPALIPKMFEEIRAGNDVVIGSRYMEGGGIKKWPMKRRVISLGATFLGRLLFPEITDPVSGFFAIRRSVVADAQLKPRGYKILLEVLGKGIWENDKEIPFEFSDREIGTSKLKIKTIIEYAQQVTDITWYSFSHHRSAAWREWKKVFKFGIVGISGIVINQGLLVFLKEIVGLALPVASIIAIQAAILNNFIWNDIWTFKETSQPQKISNRWHRLLAFEVVSAGGAVINFAVLNLMVLFLATDYQIANIIGILLGFIWNFMVNRRFTWVKKQI